MSARRDDALAVLAAAELSAADVEAGRVPDERLAALVTDPRGPAVLAAMAEVGGEPLAHQLVALEADATRDARKALRRALFRLEQRGVERPARRAAPATPRPRDEPALEAWLSGFDGRGDRIAWLLRPLDAGGLLLVMAQLNEPAGLADVQTTEVTRKALKRVREDMRARGAPRLVTAEWQVVDALLVEAHERAASAEPRRDYLRLRPRLTSAAARPPAEPRSRRLALPGPDEEPALLQAAPALLAEPELAAWWPPPEALAPFLQELASARDSRIVLSEAQEQDRMGAILVRAAAAVFPPAVMARRLEGTAYVLAETDRTEAARQALATAAAVRARPEAAKELPFLAALAQQRIGRILAAEMAEREQERRSSLVVTPGEALRARSSSRPDRTRE